MSTTSAEVAEASPGTRPLLWGRLGSLVSVLPLGVWTVNHLFDNLSAFYGAQAWERSVTEHQSPFVHALTLLIVLGPLLLHTVWGLQRLRSARPNNLRYGNYGNLKYALQRISAVGVLAFIGAHLWLAMLRPRLVLGHAERFDDMAQVMRHHSITLAVYVLGTLGVCYHLANGLSSFAWTWGLVAGRKSQRGLDLLAIGLFLALLAMAWGTLLALYLAGDKLPPLP
jgi:succinate dehydrogenase / fumarate reductase, cytochrome b subunit